jgi:SAM-dependent methyltransferase
MTNPLGDRWLAGDAYETYMGRWSRQLARAFAEWLHPNPAAHWLDVGCGTGALTSAICDLCEPASMVACDPSEPFTSYARKSFSDARVSFVVAGADNLPRRVGGFDAVVSGLVLNFLPDAVQAALSIRERLRPQGTFAAYVWDYSEGMQFARNTEPRVAERASRATPSRRERRADSTSGARVGGAWRGARELASTGCARELRPLKELAPTEDQSLISASRRSNE